MRTNPDEFEIFDEKVRLALAGELSIANASRLREELANRAQEASQDLRLDLSRVTYFDGSAAAVLLEVDRSMRTSGRRLRIEGTTDRGILSLLDWEALVETKPSPTRRPTNLVEHVGGNAIHIGSEAKRFSVFVGALTLTGLRCCAKPARLRWRDALRLVDRAGVDAVPIVVLISALMGLIMAFLGAIQLKPYGANIYVADMVALAMVRELGPIMTSILVAGRSGSGFAAEIGTMVVDDEVDALATMGFDPIEYLTLPRVLAVGFSMPALAMFSSLAGVLGGMTVGVLQLDLTITQYLSETRAMLSLRHVVIGLAKSLVFGLLAAAVGCYKGLGVQGGAEGVGRAATSAVVTAIFLIILADALFAVILTYSPF